MTSEGTCSWQFLLKKNTKTARHTSCQTRPPTCQTRNLIEFSTKPSRSLTASFPLKSYRAPTGKVCLPTTIFLGRAVKLQGCNKTVGCVWKVLACNLAHGPNWKPETSSQVATQHVKAHYFWRFVAIDHVHKHKKNVQSQWSIQNAHIKCSCVYIMYIYIYIQMNIYIYTQKITKNTSFSTKVLSSFVKKNPPNPPSTSMISQQNVAPGDCERSNDTRPWRSEVSSKNEKTGWTTPFQIRWFIYSVHKQMETDGSFLIFPTGEFYLLQ